MTFVVRGGRSGGQVQSETLHHQRLVRPFADRHRGARILLLQRAGQLPEGLSRRRRTRVTEGDKAAASLSASPRSLAGDSPPALAAITLAAGHRRDRRVAGDRNDEVADTEILTRTRRGTATYSLSGPADYTLGRRPFLRADGDGRPHGVEGRHVQHPARRGGQRCRRRGLHSRVVDLYPGRGGRRHGHADGRGTHVPRRWCSRSRWVGTTLGRWRSRSGTPRCRCCRSSASSCWRPSLNSAAIAASGGCVRAAAAAVPAEGRGDLAVITDQVDGHERRRRCRDAGRIEG